MAAAIYDTVHIGGLPPGTSDAVIRQIFGQYAPIYTTNVLESAPGQAVEALVGVAKEASAWLVQNLNGNIPQGMSTPVTIQMMPPESQQDKKEPARDQGYQVVPFNPGQMQVASAPQYLQVEGIPEGCSEDQVKQIFGQYATIVSVKSLPAGKGAATQWLLQFSTAEETKYIHETLGGNIPQGLQNPVAIRPAGSGQEAMEDQRSVQMLPGKGKGKTDFPPHVTLYVTGLPLGSNEDSLREFFVQYGDVYSSKVLPVSGGKSTMAGFVRMPEFEGGWCAENLNNFQPEGYSMPLQVTFPKDSPDKGMGKGGMANKGDHEAYAMSNGGSAFGKGDYTDFKGDSSKSWNDKGAWGNGHDANEVKSVFSGGKGSWSWDKGSGKGAAQGKDSKGWGKEKGSDKGNWGWDSGWGKGCGKATKGKGKKPGPY
eukprot:s3265_g5.t1